MRKRNCNQSDDDVDQMTVNLTILGEYMTF